MIYFFLWGMASLENLREAVKKLEEAVKELEEKKRAYEKAIEEYEDVKGKLVERILKTENFKKCTKLREKTEFLVSNFPRYDEEAAKLLSYFKPFSHKRKIIPLGSPAQRLYLVVGNTIYIAPKPKARKYPSEEEIFQTLIEHANSIIPNVRKDIREELADFCRLGKELVAELKGELVTREGKLRILSFEYSDPWDKFWFVQLSEQRYNKATIYIDFTTAVWAHRFNLRLINTNIGSEVSVDIDDIQYNPICYCELHDTLAEMLEEACEKLQAKKERCEAILKEMKKIVAPFVLSEL